MTTLHFAGSDAVTRTGVAPAVRPRIAHRVVLLVAAAFAMLAGLDAALLLLGLPAPVETDRLPAVHGVVLVLGFVGTVIALERAVALRRAWGYAAPALLAVGAFVTVSTAPLSVGGWILAAGAAGLLAVYVPLARRQESAATLIQAGGAVLATGGAVLWARGVPVPWLLPWLVGFLVLTIGGERVELAQVGTFQPRDDRPALALGAAVVAGTVATLLWPVAGYALLGAAIVALCVWLLRTDVARRLVRGEGLPRFIAVCLLAGYAWLVVAGGIWLIGGRVLDGAGYDVVVHAVFLGFVLSMIMAHAPVILPAVLRRPLPYHPIMYGPVVLLHASLLLRVVVGDVRGVTGAWQVGGVLNIVALLLFGLLVVGLLFRATRKSAVRRPLLAPEPPASERPASERPASERPASERPASERPASGPPTSEPAATQPTSKTLLEVSPVPVTDSEAVTL